ncbi:uncharacterized protein LOC132294665 [Cornus florida]|uniref:uncharacterized protein LOC132294665 n=1 Tax=Cornus florida TaxID=4283 RepID=UPI00289A85DF|nr:uncharacterized protein LOC132294665 [Cornus florida]
MRIRIAMTKSIITPILLCFFSDGGEITTPCAFWRRGVSGKAAAPEDELKNGEVLEPHASSMISPQRLGFHENEVVVFICGSHGRSKKLQSKQHKTQMLKETIKHKTQFGCASNFALL